MAISDERRESFGYVTIQRPLTVEYTFMRDGVAEGKSHVGKTRYFGRNGFVLDGAIPKLNLVPDLLTGVVKIKVRMNIPAGDMPVLSVAQVAWIETIDPMTYQCKIGITFHEILPQLKEALYQYIIKQQLN
jgi:hypothetical protein